MLGFVVVLGLRDEYYRVFYGSGGGRCVNKNNGVYLGYREG